MEDTNCKSSWRHLWSNRKTIYLKQFSEHANRDLTVSWGRNCNKAFLSLENSYVFKCIITNRSWSIPRQINELCAHSSHRLIQRHFLRPQECKPKLFWGLNEYFLCKQFQKFDSAYLKIFTLTFYI